MPCRTRRKAAVATLVTTLVTAIAPAGGQSGQPIYPAYDGFLKNPDGSYTIAFGYFSHNAEVVTISPGPANFFAPDPADRLQPTSFRPGHHRFQCVMVVGPEFDGGLRWTLSYAGTTTSTSQHMLQSNWNLVEGAAELSKIDYAKAPRGVCLNRPPSVRVLGAVRRRGASRPTLAITATAGELYSLFGSVRDEGLPRGRELAVLWRAIAGPGTVTFQNPKAARTRAIFSAPGVYELELWASDSELESATRVLVTVK